MAFLSGKESGKILSKLLFTREKKDADACSYLWDKILQKTTKNALDGTLLGNASLLRGQSAMHEMAKEPRFSRRALSAAMIEAIKNFPETIDPLVRSLSLMPSFYRDKAYVFLQIKNVDIADYDEYRRRRQAMLEIACGAAKNKLPELDTVVGIAIDAPKFSQKNAEDFLLLNCKDWTESDRLHYERLNEGFNFFNTPNLIARNRTAQEFPHPDRPF